MTHIAMLEVDHKGNTASWGPHVSEAEYTAAQSIDGA
jgi:hypothetical protein